MHVPETLCQWSNGEWLSPLVHQPIQELCIDSRQINKPELAAFFAIHTSRRDGHDFIQAAYLAGIRLFFVSRTERWVQQFPDAGFILVKDSLIALQSIAIHHRKAFHIPVIGITGSNGKTVVKEWLYQALNTDYKIIRSPKSYNSQLGVALSVWQMRADDELAIFEAGISQPGEMDTLEKIIQPTIGIFTNIGEAHAEGFLSFRQKINEKLSLFRHTQTLIYCRDYPEIHECILHFNNQTKTDGIAKRRIISWSFKGDADLIVQARIPSTSGTEIQAVYEGRAISISIPFTDAASIENAIQVWCVMLLLDKDDQKIQKQLSQLHAIEMRLETRKGISNCTIINDAYNSDLTSLAISLDYLENQKQHNRRTLILSDMLQMGRPDSELYEEVAQMVIRRGIQRFIGIGPSLYRHKALFREHRGLRSIFFKSTEAFLKDFHQLSFGNEAILLKGARSFLFEKIAGLLDEEVHQTILTIDLAALTHNLNVIRSKTGPGVRIMAMVKAFSYGSGSHEIAAVLQHAGVAYLTVAYTDEGVSLRKAGISLPIMVMSPELSAFDRMIAWKLEPEIYNLRSLEAFNRMAATLSVKQYPIHIKLDTGMHRLGFHSEQISGLITILNNNPHLHVASIFSHLAGAEDLALDGFTENQALSFESMSQTLIQALGYQPLRHLCNTAGIARHPGLHYDMVRLGLGLYGIDSSDRINRELTQISTLSTTIAQINTLPSSEGIGYGHSDASTKERRIATISIGYADGYPRALGHGKGHVLIHGKPAPTVGVVCMDMCMVDISEIPEAAEGDTALVFGPQLPLTTLAHWADTIPYELMTGISLRVKRIYIAE